MLMTYNERGEQHRRMLQRETRLQTRTVAIASCKSITQIIKRKQTGRTTT
jgi:hypothetical protein